MPHLYQSNRLEDLAELLWKIQESSPLSDPLQEEEILVQSQGMRRFIEHALAKSGGIAANFAMPAKVAFICFYFPVKHFQMWAAVKDKQTQPVKIIGHGILVDADQLGCCSNGNACNE